MNSSKILRCKQKQLQCVKTCRSFPFLIFFFMKKKRKTHKKNLMWFDPTQIPNIFQPFELFQILFRWFLVLLWGPVAPGLASKLMLHKAWGASAEPLKTVRALGATKDLRRWQRMAADGGRKFCVMTFSFWICWIWILVITWKTVVFVSFLGFV